MLYRFAVLAFLLTLLVVQTRGEVRDARNFYYLSWLFQSQHATQSLDCGGRFDSRLVDIDRAELARMLESPAFRDQAEMEPATAYFGEPGLRVHGVHAGSAFEVLGIRNGDILLRINDRSVRDEPAPADLDAPLANQDFLDLELVRADELVRIAIVIHG